MVKFINKGGPIKIRYGNIDNYYWGTINSGQIVDLDLSIGKGLALEIVATDISSEKFPAETKEIAQPLREFETEHDFYKELINIKGIGKQTAKDIVAIYKNKKELLKHIKSDDSLPIRNDIDKKLRNKYAK